MEIENYIEIRKNYLGNSAYTQLLKWIENDVTYTDARVVRKGVSLTDYDMRKTKEKFLTNSASERNYTTIFWYNFLCSCFVASTKSYYQKNNFPMAPIDEDLDLSVLKYKEAFYFKPHVDHGPSTPRTLSYIYVLNDDYEGGHLQFFFPKIKDSTKTIKVEKNCLIIFPSNMLFPHAVTPVTKGVRYSVVGWMR